MDIKLTENSFARLRKSELALIQEWVRDTERRREVLKLLICYLQIWNDAEWLDEDALYYLGIEIASVWPVDAKEELVDAVTKGTKNEVGAVFLDGTGYAGSTALAI